MYSYTVPDHPPQIRKIATDKLPSSESTRGFRLYPTRRASYRFISHQRARISKHTSSKNRRRHRRRLMALLPLQAREHTPPLQRHLPVQAPPLPPLPPYPLLALPHICHFIANPLRANLRAATTSRPRNSLLPRLSNVWAKSPCGTGG